MDRELNSAPPFDETFSYVWMYPNRPMKASVANLRASGNGCLMHVSQPGLTDRSLNTTDRSEYRGLSVGLQWYVFLPLKNFQTC